jgi:tRNA(Ile)-lysidine synthase
MPRASVSTVHRFESAVEGALAGPCLAADGTHAAIAGTVLAAVSGGPDSLALLHALARLAAAPRPNPMHSVRLHVAYFDHGLRAAEDVAAECAFVEEQARVLGLPFACGRADVRGFARARRLSLEDAARRCRYAYLGRAAALAGAETVAVGHTASDQAETVLVRILRGTGIDGLAAMDWRSPWPIGGTGPALIRPLLGVCREDTAAYCTALGLTPRHDPENESPRYLRNRVRRELLPLLRQYNPRVTAALWGLAASSRDAAELAQVEVRRVWDTVASTTEADGAVRLDVSALARLARPVRAGVLRRACRQVAADGLPPSRERLRAVEWLLRPRAAGVVELPGGVRVERRRDRLIVRAGGRGRDREKCGGDP